ncbi:hypothetical protein HPP92_018045 [Vanilla planifolia]|uniref:Uncharacterized protein n=1 Tax=Vanilla planifolia TaxID=51239 RepID=A0A835UKY9_VANPL|nr:hypothetical protein HPP92_018614 [Vanilla planifolia]KAG0468717.1 hypothetical protein HPP92_018045 [Vanilla planifolia]
MQWLGDPNEKRRKSLPASSPFFKSGRGERLMRETIAVGEARGWTERRNATRKRDQRGCTTI